MATVRRIEGFFCGRQDLVAEFASEADDELESVRCVLTGLRVAAPDSWSDGAELGNLSLVVLDEAAEAIGTYWWGGVSADAVTRAEDGSLAATADGWVTALPHELAQGVWELWAEWAAQRAARLGRATDRPP